MFLVQVSKQKPWPAKRAVNSYNPLFVGLLIARLASKVSSGSSVPLPWQAGWDGFGFDFCGIKPCSKKSVAALKYKTRWSPRSRMPTRMLSNRDNTYLILFVTFFSEPTVGHLNLTHWGGTLVGLPCLTLLRNALARHSCLTLLRDTFVGRSCLTLFWNKLAWNSSKTLL